METISLQDRHAAVLKKIAALRLLVAALGTDRLVEERDVLCQRFFGHLASDNISEADALAIKEKDRAIEATHSQAELAAGLNLLSSRGRYMKFLHEVATVNSTEKAIHAFVQAQRHYLAMTEGIVACAHEATWPYEQQAAYMVQVQQKLNELRTMDVHTYGTPGYPEFEAMMVREFVEDSLTTTDIALEHLEHTIGHASLCVSNFDLLNVQVGLTPAGLAELAQAHCQHKLAHAASFAKQAYDVMEFFWRNERPAFAKPRNSLH